MRQADSVDDHERNGDSSEDAWNWLSYNYGEVYEKLTLARRKSISMNVGLEYPDPILGSGILTDINDPGGMYYLPPDSTAEVSSNVADGYDMFADDEDNENLKSSS